MKDNIEYFGHKVDAVDHRKFLILRASYGGDKGWAMEARFWALNCLIGKARLCRLDLNLKGERARVARALELSLAELNDFLIILRDEAELIRDDDGVIWTEKTQEDLKKVMENRERSKSRRNTTTEPASAHESKTCAHESKTCAHENNRAEQSRVEQNRIPACSAEHAAAAELTEEIGKALSSCPYAARITKADHAKIAERLILSQLDAGFVAYCIKRTGEAKASNPGGFLRSALFGSRGYEEYPDAYRESRAKMQAAAPSRDPPPKTCSECSGKITLIAGEAVCGKCGAAWTWYDDWQSWERSPESYQRVDLSALKPA